jgi:hypothetical protein
MQATQALGTLTTLWTPSKRYYRINLSHLSKRAGDPIVRGWVCPNTNPRATQESPWLTFLLTNLTSRGTYKIATSLHHWRAIKKKSIWDTSLNGQSRHRDVVVSSPAGERKTYIIEIAMELFAR